MNALNSNDLFARYLLTARWYSRTKNEVKFAAFMPDPNPLTGVQETSIYQLSDLGEDEIWDLGEREVVAKRPGRRLHGRADISSDEVIRHGLEININNNPLRHAAIVNWPDEESEQLLRATELALSSKLHLC